jgi:hypothetical protein
LIKKLPDGRRIYFELASVSSWRAEKVKRRSSDGRNGIRAQRGRQLLTEASAFALSNKHERAGRM